MTDATIREELKKLEACLHCGICLSACPTYRVTGLETQSPRGRLYLMRAFLEGSLDSPEQLSAHLDPCLGCLACTTACPSGVEYGALLTAARERLSPAKPRFSRALSRWMFSQVLPNPKRLGWITAMLRLYEHSGLQYLVRRFDLARWVGVPGRLEEFIPHVSSEKPLAEGSSFGVNRKGRVVLFVGCIMNALYARVHWATLIVLVENGYEVVIPRQTCCGALAYHSGEADIARQLAQENIQTVLEVQPDWIVANAAGCGSTLRDYRHLLEADPQGEAFSDKVSDIMALLAKHPLEGELQPVDMRVAYHAACHLHHAQRVQQEPYEVLHQIPALRLVPLTEAEMCCGSAGIYNLTHTELSLAILKEKMRHLRDTDAEAVLAGNPGCMLQLETGIRRLDMPMKVLHPVELIAKAYRPSPFRALSV